MAYFATIEAGRLSWVRLTGRGVSLARSRGVAPVSRGKGLEGGGQVLGSRQKSLVQSRGSRVAGGCLYWTSPLARGSRRELAVEFLEVDT